MRQALPPFPPVATRLLAALDDENVSLLELSQLIRLDAAFTTEVLRLANSAVFALRFEVANVMHALSVLGLSRVQSLILTVALRDYLASVQMEELLQRCWRHNLASALAAEWLAQSFWVERSAAYTSALLHDIGRLALVASDPPKYTEMLEECSRSGRSLPEAEREEFGADSVQYKQILVADWKLPRALVSGYCRQSGERNRGDEPLSRVVELGCELACHLGFSITAHPTATALDEVERTLPDWAREALTGRLEELGDEVMMRLNLFECEFMVSCL